jgi:hypothetical protein
MILLPYESSSQCSGSGWSKGGVGCTRLNTSKPIVDEVYEDIEKYERILWLAIVQFAGAPFKERGVSKARVKKSRYLETGGFGRWCLSDQSWCGGSINKARQRVGARSSPPTRLLEAVNGPGVLAATATDAISWVNLGQPSD